MDDEEVIEYWEDKMYRVGGRLEMRFCYFLVETSFSDFVWDKEMIVVVIFKGVGEKVECKVSIILVSGIVIMIIISMIIVILLLLLLGKVLSREFGF